MSIKLKIHPLLQQVTGGQEIVEVQGETVGECLRDFQARFSGSRVFDEQGKLRSSMGIFINRKNIYPDLDHPVKDGDELSLLIMVGGG